MFTLIDKRNWARREYFEHYLTAVPCQYSMTTSIDISGIRRSGRKLYPAMLHTLATVINRHEEFRMAFDAEGRPGIYDTLHPSYTIFHQDTETFSSIWTTFDADYETFLLAYRRDLQTWGDVHRLEARPGTPENVYPVSMIPCENFQGFHLHLPKGDRYFFPIFKTAEDFAGLTIAVQNGSLQQQLATEQLPSDIKIELVADLGTAVLMLTEGKVDAVGVDGSNGDLFCQNYPEVALAEFKYEYSSEGNVLMVPKGETELIEAINEILHEVNEQGLYQQWKEEAIELATNLGIEVSE